MKNKTFVPGKTAHEIEKQIAELQNDIQIIDQQLTSRNLEMKDRKSLGLSSKEEFFEFNHWRNAACQAKTIKMTQLRTLKTLKKELNVNEDKSYRKIGYYIEDKMPCGKLCKDENGFYFVFDDESVTDYFHSVKELVEHLKGIEQAEGDDASENDNEEWED